MKQYTKTLKRNKIFQSMSKEEACLDNFPMENFFGIMKQEMHYGKIYRSFEELEKAVIEYIYYYNNDRIKEKLKWSSIVNYRINSCLIKQNWNEKYHSSSTSNFWESVK